jgi:hypothetical protein
MDVQAGVQYLFVKSTCFYGKGQHNPQMRGVVGLSGRITHLQVCN